MPRIRVNNLTLHYWRSGQGPDIVLVHGLGGNLAGWHLTVVPHLQRDYRLLTYDLRGHGRSEGPPDGYSTGDMVQDLAGLMDALDIPRAVIVGHSWGADIALHFALAHPERVSDLVILEAGLLAPLADTYRSREWEGWPYVSGTIEGLLGRPIPAEHRHDLEFLLRQLIEIPIQYGPAQGRPRGEEIVRRVLDVLRPMWEGDAVGNMALESLARIPHRTLLVYESNSVFLEAHRELRTRLPSSETVMLPAGKLKHFTTLEHPELILTSLRRFLAERPDLAPASRAPRAVTAAVSGDRSQLQPAAAAGDVRLTRPPGTATIADVLSWRAVHTPDRTACTFLADDDGIEALTYGELHARARALASRLREQGAGGERALLLHPPGLDFLVALFGCFYAGTVAVPLYPPKLNRRDPRWLEVSSDAQPRVALSTGAVIAGFARTLRHSPELGELRWMASDEAAAGGGADEGGSARHADPSALAYLQYTSGSTRVPKGVMVSHGNLIANIDDIDRGAPHFSDSVAVSWLPHYHDMGLVYGLLAPLALGYPCYFMSPASFLQRPRRWLHAVSRLQATHSGGPNFAYELCAARITPEQKADLDLSRWRVAFNGAEPVRRQTMERFAEAFAGCGLNPAALSPVYGLAEATLKVTTSVGSRGASWFRASRPDLERGTVRAGDSPDDPYLAGCGAPTAVTSVLIVNPETRVSCPPDEIGEIWVSSPSVAGGYWNRPEESRETFEAVPAGAPDDRRYLRTGDLGFLRDGELYVTGRHKDLIIIRGRNHYPHDIELTAQASHPALRPDAAAAIAVDVDGEERLVLIHEIERHQQRDGDDAVAAIRTAIAEEHEIAPYAVLLIRQHALPKTSSGKVQRSACRRAFLDGSLPVVSSWQETAFAAAAPDGPFRPRSRDDIEQFLVQRLARSLDVPAAAIGLRTPFGSVGLDSLSKVTLLGEFEVWLGRRLSPTLFWTHTTIADLAAHLAEAAGEPTAVEGPRS